MRRLVFGVYVLAFILAIASLAIIPQEAWRYMSLAEMFSLGFSLLVGFSGILLAYWVVEDGIMINALSNCLDVAEKRIAVLEKKMGIEHLLCASCGKALPEGDFEFCPFCGNSPKKSKVSVSHFTNIVKEIELQLCLGKMLDVGYLMDCTKCKDGICILLFQQFQ